MFRRISYKIALQFTAFVFLLFLVNGSLFLAADFQNARRQTHDRLEQTLLFVLRQADHFPDAFPLSVPPQLRDRIRIMDTAGNAIYTGNLFSDLPFSPALGYQDVRIRDEDYRILTANIQRNNAVIGFAQIADVERVQFGDLPFRAFIYLLVSVAISALTFGVGLFFARRSLKPAEQMVARLEQFTQDASHELRTPIATMSSSLDLALKTKKYQEGILSAKEDLKQVSALTERLLELARLDTFNVHRETVDLSSIVIATIDKQRPLAKAKDVIIESAVDPDVSVQGDASLLRQVIGNLLTNAIKFSKPEGGTVTVALTQKLLSVKDTGVGIDSASVPKIFDRFYQAENSRSNGGYGLGLALVKRIVELHGWTISVKSKEGKGTMFTFQIGKE